MAGFSNFIKSSGTTPPPPPSGDGSFKSFISGGKSSGDAAPAPAAAKSKKGGLLSGIAGGLGSAFNTVKSVPSMLGGLATGLYHEAKAGHDAGGLLGAWGRSGGSVSEAVNPLSVTHRETYKATQPMSYGAATSLARTARQVPDTAIGTFEPGVGFGKTDLGHQVKEEGVLGTTLAKAGDLSILAGGLGLAGDALGGSRLARIAKLDEAVNASVKALHTGETVETAAKAAQLASKAVEAGDASRAANLAKIAETLGTKEALEAVGPATRLERATAAAKTTSKFGAHVAGGPAEVWVKGAGLAAKGVKLIPGVEEALASVSEAVHSSKLAQARSAAKLIKESSSEHLTGEQARLNGGIVRGTKAAMKAAGGDTAEAAAILRHTGSADALAKLADLPDEQLAPLLEHHVGPGFTPEALRLAVSPTPEVEAAAAKFGDVIGAHEDRFVKQYGNKGNLSEAALANRAAGVEHPLQPLPIALEHETARRTGAVDRRLGAVEEESAAIRQRNLEPRTGTLSPGAERQVAADKATVRSIERNVRKEEARAATVAKVAEQAKAAVEDRAKNRTGQVIGRARGRLEEAGQLQTGVEATAKRAETTSRRLNAEGTAAEERASEAQPKKPSTSKNYSDLTPKQKAESTAAAKYAAADEAATEAGRLKGVKAPSMNKVKSNINLDAQRANVANTAEGRTTEKLTAAETRRQDSALGRTQREAEATKARAADRADRLQQDANRRLVKQDEKRLATLDERKADLGTKRASMVAEVAESPKVAPKPARAILLQSKGIADELRQHGDPALAALADALPKNLSDLAEQNIEPKYAPGGVKEAKGGSRRTDSAQVTRKLLASEREATTGLMSSSFKAHGEKLMGESRGMARNEFGVKIAKQIAEHTGITRAADVFKEHPELRGLKGADLAQGLKEAGYHPWEPAGSGRLVTKTKFDGVTASTPVLPEAYAGKVDQLFKVADGEPLTYAQMVKSGAMKAFDRVTAGARVAKLLEPGWQLKKTLGDPVMLAVMGVNPIEAAMHFPEALKAVREGNLTPGLGASAEGRLALEEPKTRLGKAGRSTTNKLFSPFQNADALAREIAYRAKLSDGLSPSAAAHEVRRGLGDLQHLTSAEKSVLKRTFTFYPWQKHVAQTLLRLPLEHPAGLAQVAHLQALAGGDKKSTAENLTNPFESSILSMIAENPARGTAALGSQVNPAIRALTGGLTGASLSRGGAPISTPGAKFGSAPEIAFALRHPAEFGKYVGAMAPPVRTIEDLLNTQPARGGKLPQRYETGEPVRAGTKHKGAVKPTTFGATTRKQVLLKMIGIEPPAPKETKKK